MNYAIILASGKGSRAGCKEPKQFIEINGKTILEHTISVFNKNENIQRIILVVCKEYVDFCKNFSFSKLYKVVEGGKRRQDSARIGLNFIEDDNDNVLIHDGARPFIDDEIIDGCLRGLVEYNAVTTGIEASDTIIEVDENRVLKKVLKRETLVRCQTPQGFKAGLIKKAHKLALDENYFATDDATLIKAFELDKVLIVNGSVDNVKITYPSDIERAKTLF